jgi:hypothetical protein
VIGRILIALLLAGGILAAGLWFLKAVSGSGSPHGEGEPEDVADLDFFFVCGECGTEYQVTKVGEVTVPRHCGEPMEAERRPRHGL